MKQRSARTFCFIAFLLAGISLPVCAQLTSEQRSAKSQGTELYNQLKSASALPYLQIAATAGDSEAQYYLGEAIRKNKRYIDAAAKEAYEASAEQGNIYSMIRLDQMEDDLCATMNNCPTSQKTPVEWLKSAKSLATEEAAQGNAESMYLNFCGQLEKNSSSSFIFPFQTKPLNNP